LYCIRNIGVRKHLGIWKKKSFYKSIKLGKDHMFLFCEDSAYRETNFGGQRRVLKSFNSEVVVRVVGKIFILTRPRRLSTFFTSRNLGFGTMVFLLLNPLFKCTLGEN